MKNWTVQLNNDEIRIVEDMARRRYKAARSAGVRNRKIGPQSNEETDKEGYGAELAFCKIFNVYPDFFIKPRSGGRDCKLGVRLIDVKGTKYKTGQLLVTMKKKDNPDDVDIYALMIGQLPKYTFVGWAFREEVIRPESLKKLTWKESYCRNQGQLHKPGELKYQCANHPGRMPAVTREGAPLCWECVLGTEQFNKRFSPDFYCDGCSQNHLFE